MCYDRCMGLINKSPVLTVEDVAAVMQISPEIARARIALARGEPNPAERDATAAIAGAQAGVRKEQDAHDLLAYDQTQARMAKAARERAAYRQAQSDATGRRWA
jgi:hypothetical protein